MTVSTAALRTALQDRHQPPDWCMAFEVQFPKEEGGLRFADAVAIDTRKTAGQAVHGFELKVSRGDWLSEVKDPEKSAPGRAACDYLWVVEGEPGIVLVEELPPRTGLLTLGIEGGLLMRVQASRIVIDGNTVVRTVDRALVAAFLRRLDPGEGRAYWEGQVRRAHHKGFHKGLNQGKRIAASKARALDHSDELLPGEAP